MSELQLHDKVVMITGAGRGLGRALAVAFARAGALVAANDISPVNLDETLEIIHKAGGEADAFVADMAKKMPVQLMIEEVRDRFGHIDILVNNAGVAPRAGLLDMDEWDWDRTLAVNLKGPFLAMQSVSRVMIDQGQSGAVLNIAAALLPPEDGVDLSAFAASKAGLRELTRVAAGELRAHNIRVNALCPGAGAPELPPPFPNQTVDLALYLCSPLAAEVTGEVIDVAYEDEWQQGVI
jgi:3-oxoacyl-[acyl-carrier protein] reductase